MSDTPWVINETEMRENDIQFSSLNPVNGFVSGEQARPLFMKSGLSPAILAQVWHLADYSKDGKMDRIEFSIAMHLIRAVLAGATLPPTLPVSLKPPVVIAPPSFPPLMVQTPVVTPVVTFGGLPPITTQNLITSGKIQGDWTIPHHNKLKYCQQFNQLDKNRIGSLSGVHARNILAQSQLSNSVLAEIWNLSDYNKDGRLSVEEFCVAMHLIDSVKTGYLLPKTLPPELATHCSRSVSNSPVLDPNAPPAQKIQIPKTFEDKRRDNYDRGQVELDRRRQALREEEERRRAEFEKKERELAEKRERERGEAERKRQAEREAELERQQKREEARLAEERRVLAEKEKARKEMERQRKADLNAIRIREIKAQRQNEVDSTLERQQRQKSLSFQIQALDEKSTELNANITQARDLIVGITKEIESMKVKRDEKAEKIRLLEITKQQLSVQYERLAHESLQMQVECRNRAQKGEDLEQVKNAKQSLIAQLSTLNKQLKDANERAKVQQQLVSKKAEEFNECNLKLTQLSALHSQLYEQIKTLKSKVNTIVFGQNGDVPNAVTTSLPSHSLNKTPSVDWKSVTNGAVQQFPVPSNSLPKGNGATGAVKYRALYEFTARSDDELSFQPGDVILAFENHAAEPGWLAGQMRDKVGWFPVAFAEPMVPVTAVPTQPPQTISSVTTSPSSEPLQSIVEEPAAAVVKSTSGSLGVSPSEQEKQLPVLGAAVALYQWKARNDNELSFSKGDTIEILEQLEMRWKGRNKSGLVGWFPKSYVSMSGGDSKTDLKDNLAKDQVEKSKESATKEPSAPSSIPSAGAVYDVVTETPAESTSGEWYVALYDFQAMEPTDLDLHAGDRILVTEAINEWWKGTCNGRTGIFPANYVQKCPPSSSDVSQLESADFGTGKVIADFEATAENQLSLKVGDMVKIQSKSSSGWWQGEIVSDGGTKKVGWFPGNYVEVLGGNELKAEALYDYQAQRDDELSFKTGDIIIVTDQSDGEWWKGRLLNDKSSTDALFPGNYVQLRKTIQPSIEVSLNSVTSLHNQSVTTTTEQYPIVASKCQKVAKELLDTEVKYCHDLTQCYEVFSQGLKDIISTNLASQLFLNFEQLISVSTSIANALKKLSPGDVFVENFDSLRAYVEFCSKQQAALEMLNELEHNNVSFRQAYRSCCIKTNGINFSYFLLLPMNRITRYPLIFEKLVKYTNPSDSKRKNLEKAHELLKLLCTEINDVISALDSSSMLIWAQQHIHCEAIQPPIVFPSSTRKVGPRCLLHSGALQKQLNGKILVALLFNDFLMLTTPLEPIEQLEEFRITKTSELQLNLYKTPLLLENAKIIQNKEMDDCSFEFRSGEFSVILRAPNRNARLFWIAQIEKAINEYRNQCQITKKSSLSYMSEQGRLFVELVCILNVDSALRLLGTQSILCKFQIGQSLTYADVDMNKKEHLCTTQLPIYKTAYDDFFEVAIFLNRIFSPDLCAGTFGMI
uniref:SH3 domain-containing protein n=2 Tax=Wuchereria bancrofti TaxID=6293 RepID=A0AAF5RTI0_WUCBA